MCDASTWFAAGRMQVLRYMTVTASKWYPHTTLILSLAFQKKNLLKKQQFEKRVLFQTKDVLD
jgi:hypothetical protein